MKFNPDTTNSAQCPRWYPGFEDASRLKGIDIREKGKGGKKKKKNGTISGRSVGSHGLFQNGRNKIRVPFILEKIENEKKKQGANSSVIPLDRNSTDRSRGGDELSLLPCKINELYRVLGKRKEENGREEGREQTRQDVRRSSSSSSPSHPPWFSPILCWKLDNLVLLANL